jgi:hypothetical protein
MKMKVVTVIVAVFGLATSPTLLGQARCGGGRAMKEGCSMGGLAEGGGRAGHGARLLPVPLTLVHWGVNVGP